MDIDKNKQVEALQKAQSLLAEAEENRILVRVNRGLTLFQDGEMDILLNDEFAQYLPQVLVNTAQEGKEKSVSIILDKLGECSLNEDVNMRERAVMVLALTSGLMLYEKNLSLTEKMTRLLVSWLRVETEFLSVCDNVFRQLQENCLQMLKKGLWQECDYFIETLYQIQSNVLEKSNAIKGMATRAQQYLATKDVLEELVAYCLSNQKEKRKNAENILIHLGKEAARYLLEQLISSDVKEVRLRLVNLIPATGNVAVPVIQKCLAEDPPWYVVRNILLILTALNNPSLLMLIKPCLGHKDIRVQQQAIDCIMEIGGDNRKKHLLDALFIVHDQLKVQLVMRLGQMGGTDIADAMLNLLEERHSFNDDISDELLTKICITVRLTPLPRTVTLLRELIGERKRAGMTDEDQVLITARHTLQALEPRLRHASQTSEEDNDDVSFTHDPAAEKDAKAKLQYLDEDIDALVAEKKVEEAGELLYEASISAARNKDFTVAEKLRDRLLEVNPMALSEVIRAGEIIEEEKSSSITTHHLSIWHDLYETMSTEEFNALYYILRQAQYGVEDIIVKQGETDSCLYFINSGQVRLTCSRGDHEIFLKRLGPGSIVGVGPFFNVSIWTVSLTAQSGVQLHVLDHNRFKELKDDFPGLESKLHDYSVAFDTVPELLKMSGEDRRQSVRFPISTMIHNVLLDMYGNPGKRSFKGELIDLSEGGLSFLIRISRRENAKLLLGRHISSEVPLRDGKTQKCIGIVVSVRFQQFVESEFSVHVKFDPPIKANEVKQATLDNR